jgi:hypothetical protein
MGEGGLWSSLMFYNKKIVSATLQPINRVIPAAEPPIVNKVAALIAKYNEPVCGHVPPSLSRYNCLWIPIRITS